MRRQHTWSAARIAFELTGHGVAISRRAVSRHLARWDGTGRHSGKVERDDRILAEELLYVRTWTCEQQRAEALKTWNIHYNYHRPHTTAGNRPPATRLRTRVTDATASYS